MLRKIVVAGVIGLSVLLTGCAQSNPVPGKTTRVLVAVQQGAAQQTYEVRAVDAQGNTRLNVLLTAGNQTAATLPASTTYKFILDSTSRKPGSKTLNRAQICTVSTTSQTGTIRFTTDGAHCMVY